jgi:hypothetical protein
MEDLNEQLIYSMLYNIIDDKIKTCIDDRFRRKIKSNPFSNTKYSKICAFDIQLSKSPNLNIIEICKFEIDDSFFSLVFIIDEQKYAKVINESEKIGINNNSKFIYITENWNELYNKTLFDLDSQTNLYFF